MNVAKYNYIRGMLVIHTSLLVSDVLLMATKFILCKSATKLISSKFGSCNHKKCLLIRGRRERERDSKKLPVKLPTGGSKMIKHVDLLNEFKDILNTYFY